MRTTKPAAAAYVGMVLVAGGSMVVFPLFPALQAELGVSTAALGVVAAAGFLAALVVEATLAPQADRGHGRRMAVAAVLLVAASLAWTALATSAAELVAARGLGGAGLGLFLPAASGLLVRQAPQRAGEALGRLGAAELGGLAVGPLLAAVALRWVGPDTVLAGAAAVTSLAAVVVGRWLREDVGLASRERPPALAFDLLRSRRVVGAVLLAVAVMVPVGAYDAIWPRYLADLGADPVLIGLSYALFAVPYAVVAAPAGRLADRIGGWPAFVRGIVVLVGFIALYAVVRDPWVATGAGVVESAAQALAFVGAAAAMAGAVDPARAASGQGLARAAGLLAATVTSVASGAVYAAGGALPLFLGTAVAVVLVTLAAWPLLRTSPTTVPPSPAGAITRQSRSPAGAAQRSPSAR